MTSDRNDSIRSLATAHIPRGWKVATLRRFLREPLAYGANESATEDNPHWPRYIRITDFGSDGSLNPETFRSLPDEVAQPYMLQEGDILLARSGATVGKSFLYRTEFGRACYAGYLIRARFQLHLLIPEFAAYFLQSPLYWNQIRQGAIQATIENVSAEKYADLIIAVPPVDVQREVVALLDVETAKIDKLIKEKEDLLKLLDERRQALITEAVTRGLDPTVPMKDSGLPWLGNIPAHWTIRKVKHLAHGICSGKTPRGGSEVYVDDGIPMIRSLNVYDDGFRSDNLVYITNEMDEDMRSSRLLPGDLLLNITGASIGRSCAYPASLGHANVNQHVCRIRPMDSSIGTYLEIVLKTPCIKAQILAGEDGTSREGLTHEDVRNLTLAFPLQQDERAKIVQYWVELNSRFETVKEGLSETVTALKDRRSTLVHEAITGRLRFGEPA